MWNIIGFYKSWRLAERDGIFYVVEKNDDGSRIVCKGTEEYCTRAFIVLIADFIDPNFAKEGP